MSAFPRCCIDCGARAVPGTNRCPAHTTLPPTTCRVCPRRAMPGERFCPDHLPTEADRLRREPYRTAYAERAYRVNRQLRYARAQGRCEGERCGVTLGEGWHCDHVTPLKDGGTNAIDNLRALCRKCHDKKTRADRAARRRSK